jgi:hypothetical protein
MSEPALGTNTDVGDSDFTEDKTDQRALTHFYNRRDRDAVRDSGAVCPPSRDPRYPRTKIRFIVPPAQKGGPSGRSVNVNKRNGKGCQSPHLGTNTDVGDSDFTEDKTDQRAQTLLQSKRQRCCLCPRCCLSFSPRDRPMLPFATRRSSERWPRPVVRVSGTFPGARQKGLLRHLV